MIHFYISNALLLLCALFFLGCGEEPETSTVSGGMSPSAEGSSSDTQPESPSGDVNTEEGDENVAEPDEAETTSASAKDIAEILESDPRFTRVLELVNLIGLLDVMRTPGPFTIFIPTNDAIDALPGDLMERVEEEPTFLHQFILAHVAEGDLASTDLVDGEDVSMIGGSVIVTFADNGVVEVGGAPVIEADIPATNGRLHALSGVIPIPEMEPAAEAETASE